MIPISSSTKLTLEQTAALVQKLELLQNEQNIELPTSLHNDIMELHRAKEALLKSIDVFLHPMTAKGRSSPPEAVAAPPEASSSKATSKSIKQVNQGYKEITKTIIDTYPEFLATMDDHGSLPLHCHRKIDKELFVYMVQRGVEHDVGPSNERGGLFHIPRIIIRRHHHVRSSDSGGSVTTSIVDNHNGRRIVVQHTKRKLWKHIESEDYELLRNHNPQLFFPNKDIEEFYLLHYTLKSLSTPPKQQMKDVKYLIDLNPNCVRQKDSKGRTPLELTCRSRWDYEMHVQGGKRIGGNSNIYEVELILRTAMMYFRNESNVGGLLTKSADGSNTLILDKLIMRYGQQVVWDIIERVLTPYVVHKVPLIHLFIEHASHQLSNFCTRFPDLVFARDQHSHRLPLHVALEKGLSWSESLLSLINANRIHLRPPDPITKLPLFGLAGALEKSCDLRTIYYLLRQHPDVIDVYCCSYCTTASSEISRRSRKKRKI